MRGSAALTEGSIDATPLDSAIEGDSVPQTGPGDRSGRYFEGLERFAAADSDALALALTGSRAADLHTPDFRVDRTGGELPDAAAEKGRVPAARVESYIDASLDWYLNQEARSLRNHERRDPLASRLEAAEAARPFLQAAFALHDRRLVPYYGYLRHDLHRRPLERFDQDPDELVDAVSALVTDGCPAAHRRLLTPAEATFRAAGHGRRFDEWETRNWDRRYFGADDA